MQIHGKVSDSCLDELEMQLKSSPRKDTWVILANSLGKTSIPCVKAGA